MRSICVIPGDGIGPEVVQAALRVLAATGITYTLVEAQAGYETFLKTGTSLPEETKEKARLADAIFFWCGDQSSGDTGL